MLRFIYVILVNAWRIIFYVPMMSRYAGHPEKYSQEKRYALAQRLMARVSRTARVTTEYVGRDRLPKLGGYVMFANHQGRYDAIGVMSGHLSPCSFLITSKRAGQPLVKQFVALLDGISIDLESIKSQVGAMKSLASRTQNGERFLVFPEGKYQKRQGNATVEFKRGCFVSAIRAKCPIVPVAVIDSYKVFGMNSLRTVGTKVVFCEPLEYTVYKDMSSQQIADQVRAVIDAELVKYR